MRSPLRIALSTTVALLAAAPAWAQSPTPAAATTDAAPAATATAAPVATAAPTAKPKATAKAAATAAAAISAVASPTATSGVDEEAVRKAKSMADDLNDEATFRIGRAKRIFDTEYMADRQKPEIERALDRAIDHVNVQVARVVKAAADVKTGSDEELKILQAEIDTVQEDAQQSADDVESVRTHDDETESTLQSISDEIAKIADRAESLSGRLDDMREKAQESEGVVIGPDGDVNVGGHHGRHGNDDRVHMGGSIEVKQGESVGDAVAMGGDVTVSGEVRGDAVAVGGDVHVTDTGRIRGDASAVGGKVIVDEGGKIDGEKSSVGPGHIAQGIFTGHHGGGGTHHGVLASIGIGLFRAAIEFAAFFLLGMLVISLVPQRTEVVAKSLEKDIVKASGLGLLLTILFPFVALVLVISVIGIPVAVVLFVVTFAAGFFGYVALAVLVGRKLPANIVPTNTAVFALGAAVIVAIGLIPIFGPLIWLLAGLPAIGAVVLTRFGQQNGDILSPPPAASTPTATA